MPLRSKNPTMKLQGWKKLIKFQKILFYNYLLLFLKTWVIKTVYFIKYYLQQSIENKSFLYHLNLKYFCCFYDFDFYFFPFCY